MAAGEAIFGAAVADRLGRFFAAGAETAAVPLRVADRAAAVARARDAGPAQR